MRDPIWEDVSGEMDLRVTVPVTMGPDRTARGLAPHLSALAGERAPASSGEAGAHPGVSVVTVDGYSGSGKSALTTAPARLVNGWQILHLDDQYPGWDGLTEDTRIACRIAADLQGGRTFSYEAWDWKNGRTGAMISVPLAPTIVKDCGAIDAEVGLNVWIADLGEDERRSRVLARDGQTYASHWQRWIDQDLGYSLPQVYAAATS